MHTYTLHTAKPSEFRFSTLYFISDNKICRQSFFHFVFIAMYASRRLLGEAERKLNLLKSVQFKICEYCGSSHLSMDQVSTDFEWFHRMYHHPNIMLSQVIPYFTVFFSTRYSIHASNSFHSLYFTVFFSASVPRHPAIENNKYLPNSLSFHQFHFLFLSHFRSMSVFLAVSTLFIAMIFA